MAEGIVVEPAYVAQLSIALARAISDAQIDHEQVRRDRYRFVVISRDFEGLGHPERQKLVWDVAENILAVDDLRRVAMIITMAPSELSQEA